MDYVKVSKELAPDFNVDIYLNNEKVGTRRFTAADIAAGANLTIERKGATLNGANQIRFVKQGSGVLYLAAALDYFTADAEVAPQSAGGLRLTREYQLLRVTENNGKPSWKLYPLVEELRSGDLIVSKLRVQGAKGRYLMVEDPIPAGCEQVANVSGINLNYSDGNWSSWYSDREFYDNRTAFFTNYFDGDDSYQYALKVITPGEFRVAPARAEMMYAPAVSANTGNARAAILDKK